MTDYIVFETRVVRDRTLSPDARFVYVLLCGQWQDGLPYAAADLVPYCSGATEAEVETWLTELRSHGYMWESP